MAIGLIHVRINLADHSAVRMTHQFGDGKRIGALLQQVLCKSMTKIITGVFDAEVVFQAGETAIHGIFCPRVSILVSENDSLRLGVQTFLEDFLGMGRHADDAPTFLSFSFCRRECGAMVFKVDMTGFKFFYFLRP